jgi:hypothetical protein
MDFGFGPDERLGVLIVGLDEGIDVLPEVLDRREGSAVEGLSLQDREPDFDLIEPGGSGRREVEMHVLVALEPAVVLGLVGVEIVEDDMDGGVRMRGDDIVHEIEEFDPAPAIFVGCRDLAGGDLERREQRRSAVALVVVTMTGQSSAVGQLQIPLGTLQGLDRGLFVDTGDDRVLRRGHVESAALATNSGSLLSHQDLRPARSIFWRRRKRQTCCSCTSPSAAAISPPVQRANPAGGGRSRTARIRLPVSALYFGTEPGRGLSARPDSPSRLKRPRHRLTVRGMVPTVRAIDRVERPSAANKMIRARKTSRCSVVVAS